MMVKRALRPPPLHKFEGGGFNALEGGGGQYNKNTIMLQR